MTTWMCICGLWNLMKMNFMWMQPWYQCAKVPPFHLDGVWPSSLRFTNNMGNHKLGNRIGPNTMVISIEKMHLEKGSHLEAFMFHHRWCPSKMSCNQIQHTIYLLYPILFCVVSFSRVFFFHVFSIFSCGYGYGWVFLLIGRLCFFISDWIIILL
jgi:hypothetical protein